jgi:ABC-2 type transport system permease protein
MSWTSVLRLDLHRWRRSGWMVVSAVVPPLSMAVLVAVLTFSVGVQPVALVNEGFGPASTEMTNIISSDTEAYKLTITDLQTASQLLGSQQVAAVIVIPPDFDEAVGRGDATLDLTLNNVDIDFGDDIRRSIDRSVAQFDAPSLGAVGERVQGLNAEIVPNPYRIAVSEDPLRSTNVSFLSYQLIPVLILLVLALAMLGTAWLTGREIEAGTMRLLRISPISMFSVVFGRVVAALVVTLIAAVPVLVIVQVTGLINARPLQWISALVVVALTCIVASGLGFLLAAAFRATRLVAMAAVAASTYLFFLGGGFTVIAFLPQWLQTVSIVDPARYAIDGLRQLLFYANPENVTADLAILALAAVLVMTSGSLLVARRA